MQFLFQNIGKIKKLIISLSAKDLIGPGIVSSQELHMKNFKSTFIVEAKNHT